MASISSILPMPVPRGGGVDGKTADQCRGRRRLCDLSRRLRRQFGGGGGERAQAAETGDAPGRGATDREKGDIHTTVRLLVE